MKSLACALCGLLWWATGVPAGAATAAEVMVNINTANAATIERMLVNVGPAKAQAIVAYREANGAFRSPEQLAMVSGVGLRTVEQNRSRIVVATPRLRVKLQARSGDEGAEDAEDGAQR